MFIVYAVVSWITILVAILFAISLFLLRDLKDISMLRLSTCCSNVLFQPEVASWALPGRASFEHKFSEVGQFVWVGCHP